MNRITYFLLPLFDISKNEKTLHIIDTQGFFCLLQYLSPAFLYPLRAWHKPAQKGVERKIRGHGLL